VRERLHQQHGAARRQRLGGMLRRGHRVAEVVQRVEEADQAVLLVGVVDGPPRELRPRRRRHRRACAGPRDRIGMRVEAVEARVRKRLGHQPRRVAMAAADVGDADAGLQLCDHAVERRQPCGTRLAR
jgi:hypothetical protein